MHPSSRSLHPGPAPPQAVRIDGWVGLAAAGLAAACAAGIAAGALWAAARPAADDAVAQVTVGLGTVRVRSPWVQGGSAARGPSDPLDLAIPWRDLAPADGARSPRGWRRCS
jgi:hypothetical protein